MDDRTQEEYENTKAISYLLHVHALLGCCRALEQLQSNRRREQKSEISPNISKSDIRKALTAKNSLSS